MTNVAQRQPGPRAAWGIAIGATLLLVGGAAQLRGVRWPGPPPLEGRVGIPSEELRHLLFGLDLLWYAALAAIGAWLALAPRQPLAALAARPGRLLLVAAGLLLLVWVPVIALAQTAVVGGQRYWWLFDDAMISMRYAHNLATGQGLVWNPGERVEGYTNLLWTLLMAAFHLLPLDLRFMALPVLAANLLIGLLTLPVLAALTRELGGGTLAVAGALAVFCLNIDLIFWSTSGLETGLLALLVTLITLRVTREARSGQPRLLTALLAGLIPLVRSDAIVLAALLLGYGLWLQPARGALLRQAAIAALLPVAQLGFRLAYYGQPLPNTAVLKVLGWDTRYQVGMAYVADLLRLYALPLLAAAGAIMAPRREPRGLLVLVALFLAYVAYVGGDAFPYFRFVVPLLPLIIALAMLGLQQLPAPAPVRGLACVLCLAAFRLIGPSYLVELSYPTFSVVNIEMGRFLAAAPPGNRAAAFGIGSTYYFSQTYGVDLLGKIDPYIANLRPVPGKTVPGHNKFDFDHSLRALRSDYVLAEFSPDVMPAAMERLAQNRWGFNGNLYLNPSFQSACLPHPVFVGRWRTQLGFEIFRTIYRCDWGQQ